MLNTFREYMASIGRKGGLASKRKLRRETSQNIVRVGEARRAFKEYYAECFWSYSPDLKITAADVYWVAEQLKKMAIVMHGERVLGYVVNASPSSLTTRSCCASVKV